MKSSKKFFFSGLFVGFFLGLIMVALIAGGFGFMALKNPHGALVRFALSKAHLFTGVIGPLVSMKQLASSAAMKLKDPALKAKYPLAFEDVPFSGSRVEHSGSLISWIAPFSARVGPEEVPPRTNPSPGPYRSRENGPAELSERLPFSVFLNETEKSIPRSFRIGG